MSADIQPEGACRQYDPELWFPEGRTADWETPRAICLTECDFLAACKRWALSPADPTEGHGMAAGMTPDERRPHLTSARDGRMNAAPCGTESGYRRHLRRGEKSCEPCMAGKRLADQLREERKASA